MTSHVTRMVAWLRGDPRPCRARAPRRADLRCTRPHGHRGAHVVVDHDHPTGPRVHAWDDDRLSADWPRR